jgi:hypothetical protein
VSSKVKVIVFWALMVGSVGFLWWSIRHDAKQSLWVPAFVVPFVLVVSWFLNRFAGSRRRTATIMVDSALSAVVAGLVAVWELIRFQTSYHKSEGFIEAVVASALFLVCSSVSVWSFLRLRKSAAAN